MNIVNSTVLIFLNIPRVPELPPTKCLMISKPPIKTERFIELDELQRNIQIKNLPAQVGKTFKVLAENYSAKSEDDLTGHSTCNRVVNFRGEKDLLGQVLSVKIQSVKKNSLFGVLT